MILPRDITVPGDQAGGRRIEVADPKFGLQVERCGMAHAAIGGDRARAGDLPGESGRGGEFAVQQDRETVGCVDHGSAYRAFRAFCHLAKGMATQSPNGHANGALAAYLGDRRRPSDALSPELAATGSASRPV